MNEAKRIVTQGLVLALVLLLIGPLTGLATEGEEPSPEEIAAWMEAISPGEEHGKLESLIGTWDTKVMVWESPDQPEPAVSSGVAEQRWILGGRYVEQQFTGTFMEMPFEGRGFIGYDRAAGHYTSIWMDNFSTGIMTETGTCDAEGKQFTSTGSYVDTMTGKKTPTRSVHRVEGPDRHVMEMYIPGPDGKEFKMMEIVYTRK